MSLAKISPTYSLRRYIGIPAYMLPITFFLHLLPGCYRSEYTPLRDGRARLVWRGGLEADFSGVLISQPCMQELSAWSEGRSRNSTNKGLTPQISCLETQCTEEGFWSPRYFSNFESLTLNKMIDVDEKNRALAPRFSPLFPLLSGVTSQEEFEAWVRKINAKSSWDIWVWGFNIIGIPIGAFLQFIYTPLVLPAVAAWQLSLPPGAASPGTIHPQVIELVNLYNDLARNPRSACAYEYGGR